jgi:methylphosphotriester-DNA--protein-cysteine methyltransferase
MTKEKKLRKKFDWIRFDSILQFKPTKKTCAHLLEVSEDTIERRIKTKYKMTFTEYREMRMGNIKIKLAQKAISKALDGDNTMLIFCLIRENKTR